MVFKRIRKIMSGQLGGIRCLNCGHGETIESVLNNYRNLEWNYKSVGDPKCPKCASENTVSGVHINVEK